MKHLFYILLLIVSPIGLFGQPQVVEKLTPQTKSMLSLFKKSQGNQWKQKQRSFAFAEVNGSYLVDAFIMLDEHAGVNILSDYGAKVNSVAGNIATVVIPIDSVEVLAALPEVKRVDIGRQAKLKMDKARIVTRIDDVLAGSELSQPFKGNGVVLGIVDTGFQYGHLNFLSPEDNSLRIKRVWDQANEKGPAPEGFYYGTELKSENAIFRAGYDLKDETHGTHVAGIAAGSDVSAPYYGAAPGSELVLAAIDASMRSNVAILDGVKYIFDYAASVDKPCVVNLSLGMHTGPHDGTSMFDKACDEMQGPGRIIVGAAGNEGTAALHVSKRISPADTLKTFLSFPVSKYGYVDFWGESDKTYKIKLFLYNQNSKKLLFSSDEINASEANEKSYVFKNIYSDGAVGLVDIYTEKNPLNNKANAYIEVFFDDIASGNSVGIAIVGDDGIVHGWVDGYETTFTSHSISGFTDGDTNCTVNEIGGTGNKIISVGAYTTRNEITNISGDIRKTDFKIDSIASLSSRGPSADGRMKPEITAPGTVVLSSFSDAVTEDNYYGMLVVDKVDMGSKSYYYGALQGTSMAAPVVAGIIATWLEAHPALSPEDVRMVFQKTAIKDTNTGKAEDNTWGYGKIDAWSGIKEVIRIHATGIFEDAKVLKHIVRTTPGGIEICFTENDPCVTVTIYSMSGQKVYSSVIGNIRLSEEIPINLNSLSRGVYFISIKGTKQSCVERFVLK